MSCHNSVVHQVGQLLFMLLPECLNVATLRDEASSYVLKTKCTALQVCCAWT